MIESFGIEDENQSWNIASPPQLSLVVPVLGKIIMDPGLTTLQHCSVFCLDSIILYISSVKLVKQMIFLG